LIGGSDGVLNDREQTSPAAVPKRNPSYNSKKLAKVLARMLSDEEREASFRAACELLKKHDRDWHDLVEAIERADILADPVPDPKAAERQTNNAWIADAVLKRFDRFLDEAHKAYLQQVRTSTELIPKVGSTLGFDIT
jgi:hypothetical protein